jgi:hypothetical protein
MNTKQWFSTLALSTVLLIPSFAKADTLPPQAGAFKVIQRTTQAYSINSNGSQTRICVNGTCLTQKCPGLSVLTLPPSPLGRTPTLATAKILCNYNPDATKLRAISPAQPTIQFSKGGTYSTQTYSTQVKSIKGGLTQIHTHQSTVISR